MCNKEITELPIKLIKKGTLFIRGMLQGKKEEGAAFDFVSAPKEEYHSENGKACSAA
jgi:hypothetical protein